MDNKEDYFSKGVRYAIKEAYANIHQIKSQLEKVKNEFGKEAGDRFLEGYYRGLTFFTHAINYAKCNRETIEEKSNRISNDYGENAKEAFLMGINYYAQIEDEKESNIKK